MAVTTAGFPSTDEFKDDINAYLDLLKLDGTLDGRRFQAKLERNSAGRARLKFEGLTFAAEPDVDTFLDAFARPGLRRVELEGEAGGRRVKRSRP